MVGVACHVTLSTQLRLSYRLTRFHADDKGYRSVSSKSDIPIDQKSTQSIANSDHLRWRDLSSRMLNLLLEWKSHRLEAKSWNTEFTFTSQTKPS